MSETEDYQKDIESIRQLMERSVKFISLSGLSGILSGIYALVGAAIAWYLMESPSAPGADYSPQLQTLSQPKILKILILTFSVLVASLITGIFLSNRKAQKAGIKLWDATAKRLALNLAIPLVTGGLFILILLLNGHFGIIAPSFLIFYGLALINGSPNLYEEVRYLGYSEILLGLVCALNPGYGLIFWAIGFGVFHILYGTIMYRKYDA